MTGKPSGKPKSTTKPTTKSTKPRRNNETVNVNDKSLTYYDDTKKETKRVNLNNKQVAEIIYSKKLNLKCKNKKQKDYLNTIDENEITICIGPAGTGKSHLAFYKALELLINENNQYQKIYLLTPCVEVGIAFSSASSLGFLKGTLEDKMSVYVYPIYYLIDRLIGKENREKLIALNIIEVMPLNYLRGMNIDNAVLICEECQNTSIQEFKTMITRIGFNSKFILSGDIEQLDKFRNKKDSGLWDFYYKLLKFPIDGISTIEFSREEIVRNALIVKILDFYDKSNLIDKISSNGKSCSVEVAELS